MPERLRGEAKRKRNRKQRPVASKEKDEDDRPPLKLVLNSPRIGEVCREHGDDREVFYPGDEYVPFFEAYVDRLIY